MSPKKPAKKPVKKVVRKPVAVEDELVAVDTYPVAELPKRTLLDDLRDLHAPVKNESGQVFCAAGCKGFWPCATTKMLG